MSCAAVIEASLYLQQIFEEEMRRYEQMPAVIARRRLIAVVAEDRARASEGRWVKRQQLSRWHREGLALAFALMGGGIGSLLDDRPRYRWEPRR